MVQKLVKSGSKLRTCIDTIIQGHFSWALPLDTPWQLSELPRTPKLWANHRLSFASWCIESWQWHSSRSCHSSDPKKTMYGTSPDFWSNNSLHIHIYIYIYIFIHNYIICICIVIIYIYTYYISMSRHNLCKHNNSRVPAHVVNCFTLAYVCQVSCHRRNEYIDSGGPGGPGDVLFASWEPAGLPGQTDLHHLEENTMSSSENRCEWKLMKIATLRVSFNSL